MLLVFLPEAPRGFASPPRTRPPDYPFLRQTPPPTPARSPPLGGPYGTLFPSTDPQAKPDEPPILQLPSSSGMGLTPAASQSVWERAKRSCRPARPRCCVSLSAGSAACTAWKVTWRWDPAGLYTPALLREEDYQVHSPPRRATCLPPLGPIVPAAATPTGTQARAPIARIRTLAFPLHPAVDPTPPPPSAAAARPAQSRLP